MAIIDWRCLSNMSPIMNFHTPRAWFHTIKHLFFDPIYLANALQIIIIFLLWMASNFRTKRSRKHAQLPVLDVPYFAQNFTSNLSYKTELGKLIYTIDSNCFLLAFEDSKWCHQTVVGLRLTFRTFVHYGSPRKKFAVC